VPTEGPLAGPATASAQRWESAPIASGGPSKSRRFVPILAAVVILVAIGVVAKFTVLDKDDGGGSVPTAADVKDAFAPVDGFTYTNLPAAAEQELKTLLESDPVVADGIESVEVRAIEKGGQPVGAVVIVGVDPALMEGEFESDFSEGFQGSLPGSTLQQSTVQGVTVTSATMPVGAASFFFDESNGLIFLVQGLDQSTADKVTKGLISANF
jgi:hypothetical protein